MGNKDMPQVKTLAIVNVTSDSFYQKDFSRQELSARIDRFLAVGCDYLDVGVESSNPDGQDIPVEEQIRRLEFFFESFADACQRLTASGKDFHKPAISLDSYRPEVLAHGLKMGAAMINDISGLADPEILTLAAQYDVPIVAMYNRSRNAPRAAKPPSAPLASDTSNSDHILDLDEEKARKQTQEQFQSQFQEQAHKQADKQKADGEGVLKNVLIGLTDIAARAKKGGIVGKKLILDPGMGFFLGSQPAQSFSVLANLDKVRELGHPVCCSVSHKSFLNRNVTPAERGHENILAEYELLRSGIEYIRTHDPVGLRRTLDFYRQMAAIAYE